MLLEEEDLPTALKMAYEAKASSQQWVYFDVIPRGRVNQFLDLWEGCSGKIVGRHYWEDSGYNPDLPLPMSVKSVTLKVQAIDIIEAAKRRALRLDTNMAKPLRPNKIKKEALGADTQR